jgi:hypothetical protein
MLNSAANLGVVVAPSGVAISFCAKNGKVLQQEEVAMPIDFETPNLLGLAPAITNLCDRFSQQIKRADNKVRMALPDACFKQSQLEFDDFPKRKSEAMSLVAWRHCHELSLDSEDVAVGFRKTASLSTGKTYVLAQSIPKQLVISCQDALWQGSLVAGQIDSLGSYLMNGLRSQRPDGWGAVFWQSSDWWCFRIINKFAEAEPQFGAWNKDNHAGDLVARRFKRIMSIYEKQAGEKPCFLQMVGMQDARVEQIESIAQDMNMSIVRTSYPDLQTPAQVVATVR